MRVFCSRFTPGLVPGDGWKIAWEIGETCSVWKGKQKGRLFTVDSEGVGANPNWDSPEFRQKHAELPGDKLYREGYFDDKPHVRVAFPEAYLWFSDKQLRKRNNGIKELGL